MYHLKIIFLSSIIFFSSCATLQNFLAEPTSLETLTALREILDSSAFRSIKKLKAVNDKGLMAVLPEQMEPVLNTLKTIGLGKEIDKVTGDVAMVSGLVLEESSLIMKDAISEVDFGDAVAIVLGGEDAATQVLREAMYVSVKKRYSDRLTTELDKTDANKYWPLAAKAFNLFSKEDVDDNLSYFLAERAVDGLFLTMGKEETEIRKDPASLGKAVVTKVFDYYTKKKTS